MTLELAQRLDQKLSPFDGNVLLLENQSQADIQRAYDLLVELLEADLVPGEDLFQVHDWDWHGGVLSYPEPLDRDDWRLWSGEPERFYHELADTAIHTGVFPADLRWYLRFITVEGDQPELPKYRLDLSGPSSLLTTVSDKLIDTGFETVVVTPARPWFTRHGLTLFGLRFA